MSKIELGDVVTIDPNTRVLEHAGETAVVQEISEEFHEPSGVTYYHYRLDLKDSEKGDWYKEYHLVPACDDTLDLEATLRRWNQRMQPIRDLEIVRNQDTGCLEWEDDEFDDDDFE
jgi:hypothetical protein